LAEVVTALAALRADHRIYAERIAGNWCAGSPATVAAVNAACTLTPDGRIVQVVEGRPWEYMLRVDEALDAVDFLRHCLPAAEPSSEQQLDAIVYYAENRSYMPIGRYYEEEHAELVDIGVEWDTGAPLPVLLANDYRTLLAFYLRTQAQPQAGLDVHVRDPIEDAGRPTAVVEFEGCRAAMLGRPGVDSLPGHRLWRRGLRPHSAFIVRNSVWTERLRQVERPERGSLLGGPWHPSLGGATHYIFTFRDSTFECAADGFTAQVLYCSMAAVLHQMSEEMLTV
jgi:hypothetical protein